MTTICRCCMRPLTLPPEAELLECPACGTLNARPQAEGPTLDILTRATRQRLHNDFYNAESSYQQVLLEYPDEHEALWGRLLCRYGVEYVEDPATGRRMPTVHMPRSKPMQEDGDFADACSFAPETVRAQYEQEAAYIDAAQAKICEMAEQSEPYDVFICHKTTVPDSTGYTEDFNRASKLYMQLKMQGYRVFFAPMELDGMAGEDYEAGIYHALHTAKVMLVICSDADYLTSAWVQSEWKRFLWMQDEGAHKRLVPLLYGGFAASRLPREFRARRLQALSMEDFDAKEKLLAAIAQYAARPETTAKAEPVPAPEARPAAEYRPVPEAKPVPPTYMPVPEPGTPLSTPWNKTKLKEVLRPFGVQDQDVDLTLRAIGGPRDGEVIHTDRMPDPARVVSAGQMGDGADEAASDAGYTPESEFTFYTISGAHVTYTGKRKTVSIPPMIKGERVVALAAFFCSNKPVRQVTIPQGVQEIGDQGFQECAELESVHIPAGVTRIGRFAFQGCKALKEIHIPDSVTTMQDSVFDGCSSLESVKLSAGVKSLDYLAFANCTSLRSIDIPDSVRKIGGAFTGCSNLSSVKIGSSVTVILGGAFSNCTSLTSIVIPPSVTRIDADAFKGCTNLRDVRLPSHVKVHRDAFKGCPWQPSSKQPTLSVADKFISFFSI